MESEDELLQRAIAESVREEELRQHREKEGKRREEERLHREGAQRRTLSSWRCYLGAMTQRWA